MDNVVNFPEVGMKSTFHVHGKRIAWLNNDQWALYEQDGETHALRHVTDSELKAKRWVEKG